MKRKILPVLIGLLILALMPACKNLDDIVRDNISGMVSGDGLEDQVVDKEEVKDESPSQNEKAFYAFLEMDPNFDTSNKKLLVKKAGLVLENDARLIDQMGLDSDYFYNGYYAYIEDEEGQLMRVDDKTSCQMFFYFEDGPYEDVSLDILLNEVEKNEYQGLFVQVELDGDYIKNIKEVRPSEIMAENYKTKPSDVVNNGEIFVKHKDIVYYREYGDYSFMDTSLWGDKVINLNGRSSIKKLHPNGRTDELWSGQGHFGIFLYLDKEGKGQILSSKKHGDDFWQEGYEMEMDIFAMDLDGKILDEYGRGTIFALDEERGLAIISQAPEDIVILDLEKGQRQVVEKEDYDLIHYDPQDGVIYYQERYKMNYGDIEIFARKIGGESKKIFSATRDELEAYIHDGYLGQNNFYRTFRPSGDYIFVHIEAREGSGDMFCGNLPLKIRKDGSGYESVGDYRQADWYGLNRVFTYYNDPPFFYEAYGYNVFNQENLIYPLSALSWEELEEAGLDIENYYGDDDFFKLVDLYYLDGDTFFTLASGIRAEEEDVGWRMAYKDLSWDVYVLRGESGHIEFLYSH